jgi:putative endonuclease
VGVTSDVRRRVCEHKNKLLPGFTSKYNVSNLVYVETYDNPDDAIIREKRLKKWNRSWKIELIEKQNPEWKDLYDDVVWWSGES